MNTHPAILDSGRTAGHSVMAFAIVSMLSALIAILFFGGGFFDLAMLIVLLIGKMLLTGSRGAAKWGMGCMGLYSVVALLCVFAVVFNWGVTRSGNRVLDASDAPWAIPVLVIVALWAATNVILCGRVLQGHRRAEQHRCPRCGYPIGTSPVCTECGHPHTPKGVAPS